MSRRSKAGARKGKSKLQATETRRLAFTVTDPLERHAIPNAQQYALGGDEYAIPAEYYDDFVRAMKQAGFIVRTAWDLYSELPQIHYDRVSGGFWRPRPDDDPKRWHYLSPVTRHWRRVPNERNRLIVRNGWALCHFPEGQRWPEFYYLEPGKKLDECKTYGDSAIAKAYAGVVGTRPIPYWADDKHLYVLWPGYVVPKQYQRFLVQHLSPQAEPLNTEMGEIWLWRSGDLELIEKCMQKLRLELRPWSPAEDWVATLATVLARSYSQLLKKRANLPVFQSVVRRRAWHELEDEGLCHLLGRLGQAEYEGDEIAFRLLQFLSEKLPLCIDWRDYPGEDVCVFALESNSIEYLGQDTGRRYYRVVFLDLQTVAGWLTKIAPDWHAEHRQTAVVSHWRALPFLGRMRTAPCSQIAIARADPNEEKTVCQAIIGIPKVEWELADIVSMDTFCIDMDPGHWRGHYDLMRYFVGYGELIQLNPPESDVPSFLLRDMLGFEFILEITELAPSEIPESGTWVRFVACTNLTEHDLVFEPSFALAAPRLFTWVQKSEALYMTLLAVTKYHFGITIEEMNAFLANTPLAGLENAALEKMVQLDDVVQYHGHYYYRYGRAKTDEVLDYVATLDPSSLPLPYHRLRGILHPLWTRSSRLRDRDEDKQRRMLRPRARPQAVLVRSNNEDKWAREAIQHLEEKGTAYVSGIGFKRSKVTGRVVDKVVEHFGDDVIQVQRRDRTRQDDKGKEHPWREYLLMHPLIMLKHVVEGD